VLLFWDETKKMKSKNSVKVLVVGDPAVGKSYLMALYCDNTLLNNYNPTIFDNFTAIVKDRHSKDIELTIYDTPGHDDYYSLRQLTYLDDVDVILLCFGVDSSTTFKNIREKWYSEVRFHYPNTPIVIIGTKIDVRDNRDKKQLTQQNEKIISYREGTALAKELNAVNYLECSTFSKIGVSRVFDEAINAALGEPKNNSMTDRSSSRRFGLLKHDTYEIQCK
jgi:Ras-related C3 botulinum toxin substrate 1